ncbi:MAG: UPF0104 family protein [Limnothrix sp. RL_2_0]|nr:UPF0104 family protein [Limnothrix sp. RL_2_0]
MSNTLAKGFKKITHLLPFAVSLLLFGLSIWTITQELEKYKPQEIIHSLQGIPNQGLIMGLGLVVINYIFLTGYDFLAVRFVRQPLPYPKVALVSILSYAISNSIGFALLSGSAIRYRFYKKWGFSSGKIAQIITFCNISFWIGLLAVGGVTFSIEPLTVPKQLRLPFESIHPVGYTFLIIITGYLIWSVIGRRSLRIKQLSLPHLSLPLSLGQIAVTSCDWLLASAVLFVLLPTTASLSFWGFFGIYLLAQFTGIISNVPGGLGIFETVLILLLSPPIASDKLLGALLAYRAIYYFIPLFIGIILFAIHEFKVRQEKAIAQPEEG